MLKQKSFMFFLSFMTALICKGEEFIYPVAQIDDEHLFVIHQKGVHDLELFAWNLKTNRATKELSSIFLPSHIKMLPNKTGFSFLNKGRIQIKLFEKRAPRAIDIIEPIDSITSMCWLNDTQFYIVGRNLHHHKVFLCDLSEHSYQMSYLTNADSLDYMYPCKMDNVLFCVIKDEQQRYGITKQAWSPTPYAKARTHNHQEFLYESIHPICFLHMASAKEGYFLECNTAEAEKERKLKFTCCRCAQTAGSWEKEELFSFKIPLQYIIGETEHRVYESIDPFLPNYDDASCIFYVNFDEERDSLVIYRYDTENKSSSRVSAHEDIYGLQGFLAPFSLRNFLCYGLIISPHNMLPTRSILNVDQESGGVQLHLPIIPK